MKDAQTILEMLIMDTERYTQNEYMTLSKLLALRSKKYYSAL